MTTHTATIADFVLERLAEDEAVARDSHYKGQRWIPEEEAVVAADRDLDPILFLDRKRDALHAARHDPARVLAQCAAMRAVVEMHRPNPDSFHKGWKVEACCEVCVEFHADMDCENKTWPCGTLRALASIWADHPDFRDEWRS